MSLESGMGRSVLDPVVDQHDVGRAQKRKQVNDLWEEWLDEDRNTKPAMLFFR